MEDMGFLDSWSKFIRRWYESIGVGGWDLLAIIREYGLGIDCASGNELRKAVEAGFDPKGIVYAGVGKRLSR